MQKFNGSLVRQFPSLITGNAASGVSVTVYTGTTGTNLATLFSGNGTGSLPNPITTDAAGYYGFYAADGQYRLKYSVTGIPDQIIQLLDIESIAAGVGADIVSEEQPTGSLIRNGIRWYKPSKATTYIYYFDGDSGQWVTEFAYVPSVYGGGVSNNSNFIDLGTHNGGFVAGDGSGSIDNNNAVWASALALAAITGQPIFIPPITSGEWHYSVTPVIPSNCSGVLGVGYASKLRAVNCDGIAFAASDIIGAKVVRDFSIFSNNVFATYAGLKIDAGTNVNNRLTGVSFSNIYIAFFDTAVSCRGLWHSKFTQIVTNNCWNGFDFYGRSISVNLDSCKIQVGSITRAEDRRGVWVRDSNAYDGGSSYRPEAIKITNETLIFGFDYQIDLVSCLNFAVTECDIDFGRKVGVRVSTVNGGCSIENNWIAGDVDGFVGIQLLTQSVDSRTTKTISGNTILMNPTFTGARGIFLGGNNGDAKVSANDIADSFGFGIYLEFGSSFSTIKENTVKASVSLFVAASGNDIENNDFTNPVSIFDASYRNNWCSNRGGSLTRKSFVVTMPTSQTTTSFSIASLSSGAIVTNQKVIINAWQVDQGTSAGAVWAITDNTNIQVFTSSAINAPTEIGLEVITL